MITWAWTLIAVAGAILSMLGALDASRDLRALGTIANGRRLLALGDLRRELIRLSIQVVWTLIGLESALHGGAEPSLGVILLMGTNAALAISTLLDLHDRARLRRILG